MSQLITAFSLFGLLALAAAFGVFAILARSGRRYMSLIGLVLVGALVWQVTYVLRSAATAEDTVEVWVNEADAQGGKMPKGMRDRRTELLLEMGVKPR